MTTTEERRPLPPIQCQPWCVHQDGHPDQIFAEDQRCESAYLTVDLSLWPVVDTETGKPITTGANRLAVYAEQVADGDVGVLIEVQDERPTATLTLREARELVANLQLLLGQVEAQR